MNPRLLFYLFLLTLITVSQCTVLGRLLSEGDKCKKQVSITIGASLQMTNLTCRELDKVLQPRLRPGFTSGTEGHWNTRPFTPNIDCPTSLPVDVSVQLTAENGTIYCAIQDPEQLGQNCGYTLTLYYQDKVFAESTIRPSGESFYIEGETEDFETSKRFPRDIGKYPNFSIELSRKSDRTTLNGIYQCSIRIMSTKIDSNAIYYHWEDSSPVISSKKVDHSLIGELLRCDLGNYEDTRGCNITSFDRLRSIIDLVPENMRVTEAKHPWNPNDRRINYTLKYHQTGNETIYEAECRIKDDLRVNIEDDLPSVHVERVCFGVNDLYIGCYLRWSNWNHSIWNPADSTKLNFKRAGSKIVLGQKRTIYTTQFDDIKSEIMISKKNRIELENGEVFTVLMKNLSEDDRRFWCVKTLIFGTLLSEHSFESNYLSKPEAELLPGTSVEMTFERALEPEKRRPWWYNRGWRNRYTD